MPRNFEEAMKHRRTYYSISNSSPISDLEIEEIVKNAVMHIPSAFNSQSTRILILFNENHKKFWDIVKSELRKITTDEAYKKSEVKVDTSFACGYATILYFEDQEVVENLQKQYSAYSDNFPVWSQHTSAMHQWAIWTMLEDAGLGVSLQHYNPIVDREVTATWKLNPKWKLIAQMPFGLPTAEPGEKEFDPIKERVVIFK